jgi:hypothetical protein
MSPIVRSKTSPIVVGKTSPTMSCKTNQNLSTSKDSKQITTNMAISPVTSLLSTRERELIKSTDNGDLAYGLRLSLTGKTLTYLCSLLA